MNLTVGTSPIAVIDSTRVNAPLIISNATGLAVYLGPPNVTVGTGYVLAPGASLPIKSPVPLYAVASASAAGLNVLSTFGANFGGGGAQGMFPQSIGGVTPTYNSENPALKIARTVSNTGDHAHGVVDHTNFNQSVAAKAYNSYDSIVSIGSGTSTNYDHYAAFQARGRMDGTGTLTNYYGLVTIPVVNSGTVASMRHIQIFNAIRSGSGAITTQYGLVMESLSGATFNVPIASTGTNTTSWHEGKFYFGNNNIGGANNQVEIKPAANRTALGIVSGSLTGSSAQNSVDIAYTWNTTGSPTAIKVNITNTASGADSKLLDLRTGGVSLFSVGISGKVTTSGVSRAISVKTTAYTVTASDHFIIGNHATVAFTVTLVAASSNTGREYIFQNKGAANMTIDATGLGQITNATANNTIVLTTGQSLRIISDGATWISY